MAKVTQGLYIKQNASYTKLASIRDKVNAKGGLAYLIYMSKAVNNNRIEKDALVISSSTHNIQNIEVARLELALEKIKKDIDFVSLLETSSKINKAINSGKSNDITISELETIKTAVSVFESQVNVAETHYTGIMQSVRKYPTMEALNNSTSENTTLEESQDEAVKDDVLKYGAKKEKENNYKQIVIIALVIVALFLIAKFL